MSPKTKKILKFILIFIVIYIALNASRWNLEYKEYKMNQMLMEHNVMDSNGELLPPYSGE